MDKEKGAKLSEEFKDLSYYLLSNWRSFMRYRLSDYWDALKQESLVSVVEK